MPFIFNNRAVSHLVKGITSGETELRINQADFEQFNRYGAGGDAFMFCVLRGPTGREIVKIIPDESNYPPDPYLVCERGQGGTVAEAWPAGTLLYLCTTADHYSELIQPDAIRQVEFNPNGVLTPAYVGEKIMQYTGCAVRWWQGFTDTDPYWHLIAGEPCAGENFENPTGSFVSNVWMPVPPVIPTWLPVAKERYPTGPQYWQAGPLTNFNNTAYYWQAAGSPPLTVILDVYRNGGPDLRASWPFPAIQIRGMRVHSHNGANIPKVEIDMGPGPPGWETCTKQFLNVVSGSDLEFNLSACDPGYTSTEIYGVRIEVNSGQHIELIEVADEGQADFWGEIGNIYVPIADPVCFDVLLGSFDLGGGPTPPGYVGSFGGGVYTLILGMYVNPGTIDNRTVCGNYPSPPPPWGRRLQYIHFTDFNDVVIDDIEIYVTFGPTGSIPWLNTDGYGRHSVKMSDLTSWQDRRIDWYPFNMNEWSDISQITLRSSNHFRISSIRVWDNGP
jgi:hypothetical protein